MCRCIVLGDCDRHERILRCNSFNRPMNIPHTVTPGALLALLLRSRAIPESTARYVLTCRTGSRGARERETGAGRDRESLCVGGERIGRARGA